MTTNIDVKLNKYHAVEIETYDKDVLTNTQYHGPSTTEELKVITFAIWDSRHVVIKETPIREE